MIEDVEKCCHNLYDVAESCLSFQPAFLAVVLLAQGPQLSQPWKYLFHRGVYQRKEEHILSLRAAFLWLLKDSCQDSHVLPFVRTVIGLSFSQGYIEQGCPK